MVLEALTAVGLAGNVVQFIQFSCDLVSLSSTIRKSTDGFSSDHADLHMIAQDIEKYSQGLKNAPSSNTNTTLDKLARRSNEIAKDLLKAVNDIREIRQKDSHGKHSKSSTFRQALATIWKKDKIANLQSRLELLRDQMQHHLISKMRGDQVHMKSSLKRLREDNAQSRLEFSDKLIDIARDLDTVDRRFASIQSTISLKELEHSFSYFSSNVEEMAQISAILKSLQFHSMGVRHATIAEAHKCTFDWIFLTKSLPEEDPRSRIQISSWLQHDTGIYWITGKPGSGKSTLMKYLDNHESTNRLLHDWAYPSRLVIASFYFWNPGTRMQKSLHGLLQSLLHCILSSSPELAEALCPARWNSGRFSAAASSPWSVTELHNAFKSVREQQKLDVKFYFHIDGLDEYEGDYYEVIRIIEDLAKSPVVKLCVSSRPWNQFQDTIGRSNHGFLQLHTLTERDIELFARETILSHCKSCTTTAQAHQYYDLINDIRRRAEGVFLWVRLVVRSLRDGLVNDDQVSLLQQRLEELPTDLEDFFEHILNSVEKVYRERMARTFLAVLTAPEPLSLIHYSFLDEEDPTFGWSLSFSRMHDEEISDRCAQTLRRLNGRYKGLLEPSSDSVTTKTIVDFLHRTLRDFLTRPRIKTFLDSHITGSFNPWAAIVQVLLAEAKYVTEPRTPKNFASVLQLARSAAITTGDDQLEYSVIDHVELACQQMWSPGTYDDIDFRGIMVNIAIHIGREDYLEHIVRSPDCSLDKTLLLRHLVFCRSFIDKAAFDSIFRTAFSALGNNPVTGKDESALRCDYRRDPPEDPDQTFKPAIRSIQVLLQAGADPNQAISSVSIWREFLVNWSWTLIDRFTVSAEHWDIFKLMVVHGSHIQQHTDVWLSLIRQAELLGIGPIERLIEGFSLLLDYGLNPNARTHGNNSIWLQFMMLLYTRDSNIGLWDSLRNLVRSFLCRGASLESLMIHSTELWGVAVSWLHKLIHELGFRKFILGGLDPIAIFDIFLQHGLDPNMPFDSSTVWEHLLQSLVSGITYLNHDREYAIMIRSLILLFLRYRADPHSERLRQILNWATSGTRILSASEVSELEFAVRREIDDIKSRDESFSPYGRLTNPPLRPFDCYYQSHNVHDRRLFQIERTCYPYDGALILPSDHYQGAFSTYSQDSTAHEDARFSSRGRRRITQPRTTQSPTPILGFNETLSTMHEKNSRRTMTYSQAGMPPVGLKRSSSWTEENFEYSPGCGDGSKRRRV